MNKNKNGKRIILWKENVEDRSNVKKLPNGQNTKCQMSRFQVRFVDLPSVHFLKFCCKPLSSQNCKQ